MNGITMWRPDPGFYGRNPFKAHFVKTCTNRAKSRRSELRANNGEARADHQSRSRRADGCCQGRCERQRRRKGAAAGASVESAVLRRSRHANRRRWYVVLHGDANRTAGAGPAVFDHPQARGRQALSRDTGGEGRHPRRRCAVSRGRDGQGKRRPGPAAALPHQCRRLGGLRFRPPAAIRGGRRRRPDALSSRPRRPVGQGHPRALLRSG